MIQLKWIERYQQLNEEITGIEWDIESSNLELQRWEQGGDLFYKNSFQTSLDNQQRIITSLQKLEIVLEDKKKLMSSLMKIINNFKGIDHQILKLKYIDGMTLEMIAEELNYSTSHIRKRHAELSRTIKLVESLKGVG